MITGPLLLIALTFLVAPVIWLLRRWATLAALLSSAVSLLLALMAWSLPLEETTQLWGREIALGETVSVLGRELVMSQTDRLGLVFMFLVASGLFLFAWRVSQGWTFYPLGLIVLGVLGGALLIESHIFAVLFLQIAAALCVFLIQGGQTGSTRGALRFLTFVTLAIAPILVTSWFLGRYEWTPDDTSLLDASIRLFAFGFAILVGVVPFHIWIPAVSEDAPPLVATFILGIFYAVVWFILLNLIESYQWLAADPGFRNAMSYSGYLMVALGTVMASVQRRLGRMMGYAALADMGVAQLALGLGTTAGLTAALAALGARAVSMAVMSTGISVLRHRAEGDDFENLVGWGRHAPWATVALVVGGLSLAGMPPGAGFAARWSITHLLARESAAGAGFVLLAGVGVSLGVVRALLALLSEPEQDYVGSEIVAAIEAKSKEGQVEKIPEREPRLASVIIIAAIALCLALGLWPQLHMGVIEQVTESYTFISAIAP